MLVGDQNGVDVRGVHRQPLEPQFGLPQGESTVDEQQRLPHSHTGGVAPAAAAEGGEGAQPAYSRIRISTCCLKSSETGSPFTPWAVIA